MIKIGLPEKGNRYDRNVKSYHANHERTLNEITARSDNAWRTDTRPVNTRTTILAIQQVTAVNKAVCTDEAERTEAPPSAVTGGTVTTRVIGLAVRLGTSATDVLRPTGAAVAVHEVVAGGPVQTWTAGTFVYVRPAIST